MILVHINVHDLVHHLYVLKSFELKIIFILHTLTFGIKKYNQDQKIQNFYFKAETNEVPFLKKRKKKQ